MVIRNRDFNFIPANFGFISKKTQDFCVVESLFSPYFARPYTNHNWLDVPPRASKIWRVRPVEFIQYSCILGRLSAAMVLSVSCIHEQTSLLGLEGNGYIVEPMLFYQTWVRIGL